MPRGGCCRRGADPAGGGHRCGAGLGPHVPAFLIMNENDHSESAKSLFEPAGFVLIRTPLLPVDTFQELNSLLESPAASNTTTGRHSLLLDKAIRADTQTLQERLRVQVTSPVIQEALLTGSPDLFRAIPRWQRAPEGKKGRVAQSKLLRYLTRMATRPTPFGLFAGVALGHVGPEMDVRVGSLDRNRKRTRPDMQWLLYLVRSLEERAEVAAHLRFFTNPMTFTSGGRLYLPHLDAYGQAEPDKTVSLRATPVVKRVMALARQGAALGALKQQLLTERPDATEDQIEGLLSALREHGVLLSDLRPPLTGENAIRHVLDRIEGAPGCDDIREQLQTVLTLAETYDEQPLGQGIATFQTLYEATEAPDSKIHSTLEVDMATALGACTFSKEVADELTRATEALLRVSTYSPQFPHLAAYRREFIQRYGERREVPVLELLDEDLGLGPPPNYQHPPRTGESKALPPPQYPLRDRALLELAGTALRDGQREIELDEATLSQLQVRDSWREQVPDSLELYAFVAALSQAEINDGDFLAIIGPRVGANPAGRSFGRFCDIMGKGSVDAVAGLAREEEKLSPGRILAELVYLPTSGHAANVAIRPAVRRYEVVVAAAPGVPHVDTIPMDDLVVGVRGGRFYLRSVSRDAEVVITSTHLLNYFGAPNECRFLAEVSAEGVIPVGPPFDWGAAAQLPFLPRMRVGRAVLCPAEWRLPVEMVGADQSRPDAVWWYELVQDWRQKWDVPRYVYLANGDNRLLLDLENQLCVADLGDECRKRRADQGVITLQEMLPGFEDVWAEGADGRYLLEFVVPLKRHQPTTLPEPEPVKRGSIEPLERLRLPGSDWLYAKLYSGRTRHDDLLAGPVREFAGEALKNGLAKRWFFVRYNDPDPHIRLRFQGEPKRLLSQLLPALTAWGRSLVETGLLRKLVLDSYDREIERYGGLESIQVAEQIFAADSIAVTDIVALRIQRVLELAPVDLAVLTVDDLSSSLGLAASERFNLYRTIWQGQKTAFGSQIDQWYKTFHTYRRTAQRIVGDREWLRAQPGGSELEECLRLRATTLRPFGDQLRALAERDQLWISQDSFLASCVHMHCNRLLGINRPLEFEVIYHLERTLESLERYVPDGIHI
ncbi:MAG: lantibiotic dehydratase [Chloroflexota bacterium]|nr:lantibiotic dehydratase [Chloroflexota bacterium]